MDICLVMKCYSYNYLTMQIALNLSLTKDYRRGLFLAIKDLDLIRNYMHIQKTLAFCKILSLHGHKLIPNKTNNEETRYR